MAETDGSDKVLVELFIHQSPFDRRRLVAVDEEPLNKGAGNPIDEQWKLCFTILAEKGYLDLLITNIDPNSPPPFFKELGTSGRLPDIRVVKGSVKGKEFTDLVCDTNDDIEEFIRKFECDDMRTGRESREEAEAEKMFLDLHSHLNSFLLHGESKMKPLTTDLKKINDYLAEKGSKFLLCDNLTFADCQLIPRLQHVRLAAKFYRDFDIPVEHEYLWKYLENVYAEESFRKVCATDQDIICHYDKKLPGMKKSLATDTNATYTWDVPVREIEKEKED